MPKQEKPSRRPTGYFEAQDKMLSLRRIYQTNLGGSDKARLQFVQAQHRAIDDIATPEPDEELDASDLSDHERQQAIARERMRREGRT